MTPPCLHTTRAARARTRLPALAALAIVLVLGPSGCATSGINQGDLNLVSQSDEWQLGQQLEREIAQQLKLVDDPTVVAYVDRIGQRIVAQTEMASLPWEFHVVADKSINAFNVPGGHVYVNTGLIMAAGNASELAGVMAHEIAHGVARHSTERLSKVQGISLGAGLLLGQNPSAVKQLAAQLTAGGIVAKFSRDDEREADRLGVRYMYAAGYSPEGMAAMFGKLLSERKRRPSGVEQFFSSHPLTEDRIASVRQLARTLPRKPGLVAGDGRLKGIQQRVRSQG